MQTSNGLIGHVNDFIMDDKSWEIRHVIVQSGHWFSHGQIAISPQDIDSICYEESKVLVNSDFGLTAEDEDQR